MGVISELLGVDVEFKDQLHHLCSQLVATDTGPREAVAANRELVGILPAIAVAKAERPGDDLTSTLIAARDEDGDRLGQEELIGTPVLMITAGHEATLNLITNAVRALCGHHDQLALVRKGEASRLDVVEETLRRDAPVSCFPFRYPVRDLTPDGTLVPQRPLLSGCAAGPAGGHGRTGAVVHPLPWPGPRRARGRALTPVSSATVCGPFLCACDEDPMSVRFRPAYQPCEP